MFPVDFVWENTSMSLTSSVMRVRQAGADGYLSRKSCGDKGHINGGHSSKPKGK